MQIWSCALIATISGEEKRKFWLCLCFFLVRDVLYVEGASMEKAAREQRGLGVDWFGEFCLGVCVWFDWKIGAETAKVSW